MSLDARLTVRDREDQCLMRRWKYSVPFWSEISGLFDRLLLDSEFFFLFCDMYGKLYLLDFDYWRVVLRRILMISCIKDEVKKYCIKKVLQSLD